MIFVCFVDESLYKVRGKVSIDGGGILEFSFGVSVEWWIDGGFVVSLECYGGDFMFNSNVSGGYGFG